jgi:hypothetical protein
MPGYIYLIMMADGVYKVGRTQQEYGTHLKRLKAYPADSSIVYTRKVANEIQCEKEVLRVFRREFGTHPRGHEYFKGDEERMIEIINEKALEVYEPEKEIKDFLKNFYQMAENQGYNRSLFPHIDSMAEMLVGCKFDPKPEM